MDGSEIREQEAQAGAAASTATDIAAESNGDVFGASLMEQFLNDPSHDYKTLKYGDVMDGTIMHIDRDELLVDIGSKAEGIVPAREYSTLSSEEKQALTLGDQILVFVVQPEIRKGTRSSPSTVLVRRRAGGVCRICTKPTRSSRLKSPTTTRVASW